MRPLLGVVLLVAMGAAPIPAAAQPAVIHRVATLGSEPTGVWDAFERRLAELGWVEGRNVRVERRWSHGFSDRVPALVAEALATRPDVLVASLLPGPLPASAHCAPILAIGVAEPYGACRVFPVANVSPIASARDFSETHLRLATAAVPSARRVSVVTDPGRPFLVEYVAALRRAAHARGIGVTVLELGRGAGVEALADELVRQSPDALIVAPSFGDPHERRQIVARARRLRIPAIGAHLMDSLVVAADYDWRELARRAASLVDQILKGADASELDRQAPPKFEVVVDRRAAAAIGLTLPDSLLTRADRVLD
jgi:putative ABC transport system substrate-binding protein